MKKDETISILSDFINSNTILTLATSNKEIPYVANVFYVADKNMNLYFLSGKKTRHVKEFSKNSNVSVSIYDPHSAPGKNVCGIQCEGTITEAKGLELVKNFAHYLKLFPATNLSVDLLKQAHFDSRLFKFVPSKIFFMDKSHFEKRQEVLL